MAKKKKKPKSVLDLAKSGGSQVALAARFHGGAGKHEKEGVARRRAERRDEKTKIRDGQFD